MIARPRPYATGPEIAMRGRLKRATLSTLAVMLGVAQLGAASPPSEDVQRARIARDAFYKCALMTVPDYDDRVSPANVVAKAVAAKCQSWVDAMLKYMPRPEGAELHKEIMRGEEGNLLGIVLRNRVLRSTLPPPVATRGEGRPPRQSGVAQGRTAQKRTAPE